MHSSLLEHFLPQLPQFCESKLVLVQTPAGNGPPHEVSGAGQDPGVATQLPLTHFSEDRHFFPPPPLLEQPPQLFGSVRTSVQPGPPQ